jgi:hypothetical protein
VPPRSASPSEAAATRPHRRRQPQQPQQPPWAERGRPPLSSCPASRRSEDFSRRGAGPSPSRAGAGDGGHRASDGPGRGTAARFCGPGWSGKSRSRIARAGRLGVGGGALKRVQVGDTVGKVAGGCADRHGHGPDGPGECAEAVTVTVVTVTVTAVFGLRLPVIATRRPSPCRGHVMSLAGLRVIGRRRTRTRTEPPAAATDSDTADHDTGSVGRGDVVVSSVVTVTL